MNGRARASLLLVATGVLAWWSPADSQGEGEREQRREQLRQSRALLGDAGDLFAAGAYDSAGVRLRVVLENDQANPDAHYLLGRVLLAQGDTAAAVTITEQGVGRAPLSTRLKLLLARLQIEAGRADEAGRLLDEVLALCPRDGEVLYLRGLAHFASGDSLAALAAWRSSLAIVAGGPEL
jgi:predicted Zn-dependent protease